MKRLEKKVLVQETRTTLGDLPLLPHIAGNLDLSQRQ